MGWGKEFVCENGVGTGIDLCFGCVRMRGVGCDMRRLGGVGEVDVMVVLG